MSALRIRVIDVQRAVACVYGVRVDVLTGPLIYRSLSWPRQVAMALALELTGRSQAEIGARFDRDHTTVRHAARAVCLRAARDHATARKIEEARQWAVTFAQEFRDEMSTIARDAEARERAVLEQLPVANSGRAA